MSKNHGRRIIAGGVEARHLETKSAQYDAFAGLIRAAPEAAAKLGIRLLSRREAAERAACRRQPEARR